MMWSIAAKKTGAHFGDPLEEGIFDLGFRLGELGEA